MKYYAKILNKIDNGKGFWKYLNIGIFEEDATTQRQIGSYKRNYPSLFNTFCPFEISGQRYALYSKDYTSTRIMSLPDCVDMGGEDRSGGGFCPTDYYVPYEKWWENGPKFGFVAGCVWGDDWSWKIQFLDLNEVSNGIIKRDDRFGYISLPSKLSLEQAINMDEYWQDDSDPDFNEDIIEIAVMHRYGLDGESFND